MLELIKFRPQYFERLWGGRSLESLYKKRLPKDKLIGESWEISAVQGSLSVIKEGALKGNNIEELIEIYMGDVVGEKVYEQFGLEFPLLTKFIDAKDVLSIQVHPGDELARKRHSCFGKTEMWHIVSAEKGAVIYLGFKKETSSEEYVNACVNGTLPSLLNKIEVKKGESYIIPSGTIHAIGAGIVIAEIQQTSDVTYRVNDWNRLDSNGEPRDLHEEEALDAIDFSKPGNYNITKPIKVNEAAELVKCKYFTVNEIELQGEVNRDYSRLDSFVICMLIDGEISVNDTKIKTGESILIPAIIEEVTLTGCGRLLEIYID
ncbi:MAG: type I phosphomannose isomerase catalytic subunit [Rikenellaceae bacterium]